MKDDLLLLHQVIAARMRCRVMGDTLYVVAPSLETKVSAQELYFEVLHDAELQGVMTDREIFQLLIDNNLWSVEEEEKLNTSPVRIDALKEDMYLRYASYQSKQVERDRHLLARLRKDVTDLFRRRHIYDMYTCQGLAMLYQLQYILSFTTLKQDGVPLDFGGLDDIYMRYLADDYINHKPSEAAIRQLAKCDAWKSIWMASKCGQSIFTIPAVLFTDEQRSLLGWSRLYDNVAESMECPDKEVIEDDDLLDGWLITQHKKRDAEKNSRDGENKSKNGANEMFLPAETVDDAKRIAALNDPSAQIVKQQRMALLRKKGTVSEEKMPDSQQRLLMQATAEFHERMRRK